MGFHITHLGSKLGPPTCQDEDGEYQGTFNDRMLATSYLYLLKMIQDSSFHMSDDLTRVYCREFNIKPIELSELRTMYTEDLKQFYEDCVASKLGGMIEACKTAAYHKKDGLVVTKIFGDKVMDFYSKHIKPNSGRGVKVLNRPLALTDIKTLLVMFQMRDATSFALDPNYIINEQAHQIYQHSDMYPADNKSTLVFDIDVVYKFLDNMGDLVLFIQKLGNGTSANRQDVELITYILEIVVRLTMLTPLVMNLSKDQIYNLCFFGQDYVDAKARKLSLIDETAAVCIFDNKEYNFGKQDQSDSTDTYRYLSLLFKYIANTSSENTLKQSGEFNALSDNDGGE